MVIIIQLTPHTNCIRFFLCYQFADKLAHIASFNSKISKSGKAKTKRPIKVSCPSASTVYQILNKARNLYKSEKFYILQSLRET